MKFWLNYLRTTFLSLQWFKYVIDVEKEKKKNKKNKKKEEENASGYDPYLLISSRSVFCKKDALKNFANLTGTHLCQITVSGLQLY